MTVHIPVLPREAIDAIAPRPGDSVLDGTLGGGGHTRLLAGLVAPGGVVLAVDRDPRAVEEAMASLRGLPVMVAHAGYEDAPEVVRDAGLGPLRGVLLDLGLSSDQLADRSRGFSFHSDGPLDLRFDDTAGEPASRLVNRLSAEHLADLIFRYGEERYSRRIARAIVQRRQTKPFETASDLADVVRRAAAGGYEPRLDPATRTFQALRIAANDELGRLERALARLPALLAPGGRIAVISFHSLEDRIVKEALRQDPRLAVRTPRPIRPTEDEVAANPRARSARLRVAERVEGVG